jgi:putative ABC transport system substrate-binding protein
MRRRIFIAGSGGLAVVIACGALAQGGKPLPRVSFLSHSSPKAWGHLLQEFRNGLRDLGYVEGRDLILDTWWAEDRLDRIPELVAATLKSGPAVIVTHGSPNVAALQKATSTVPIVFAAAGDPVGQGFVQSYRRPGGNITGVAVNNDVNVKIVELVKIVMPSVSRVGVLINPQLKDQRGQLTDILPSAAKPLGLQPLVLTASAKEGLEPAFTEAVRAKMQAIVVAINAPFVGLLPELVALQFKHRLPTFYGIPEGPDAGGLASYGSPQEESYRRAAALVVQILKGRSPAELPVEIPSNYEITINLKTAEKLGIKVPETALLRAQKVIRDY